MSRGVPRNGIVLGLVGPVCAGKSEVARRLRERGARVFEADAVVRQLYDRSDVRDEVRRLFGTSVIDATGAVDRPAIARRIFGSDGDAALRRRLTEEIIFPRTGPIIRQAIDEFRSAAGADDVLVLDAPTLFEAGRDGWCDHIVWVTAPVERRRDWASARGWPHDELDRRDASLWPEEVKRRRADFTINNSGTPSELVELVDRLWEQLRRGAKMPGTGPADKI